MRPSARLCTRCVVAAALFAGLGCGRDGADLPAERSIRLLDLDGKLVDLWPPDRPAVTVVLFTRTDCPIANRYAPDVRRLHEAYHPRGVEFFLVYVDPRESPDDVRRHLAEYGYPCPGVLDTGHTLVAYCHATATPEAVVFAADRTITYQGRIDDRYTDLGRPRAEPTSHDLADALAATVGGRPVAVPRTNAVGCLIADLKD
jgi:Redoxin